MTSASSVDWDLLFPNQHEPLRLYGEDEVRIRYHENLAARTNIVISAEIEATWEGVTKEAARTDGVKIIDRPKFRLASVLSESDKVTLHLGPSSYRDYIAYRSSPMLLGMAEMAATQSGADVHDYLPNVIGNAALVLMRDSQAFAILRSNRVATYRGYLDLPGGHPEPDVLGDTECCGPHECHNLLNRIRRELFSSVVREIREDLGLEPDRLTEPRLLCVLQNCTNVMKPEMVFVLHTDIGAAELRGQVLERLDSNSELSDLVIFDPLQVEKTLSGNRVTPVLKGAASIFREFTRQPEHGGLNE